MQQKEEWRGAGMSGRGHAVCVASLMHTLKSVAALVAIGLGVSPSIAEVIPTRIERSLYVERSLWPSGDAPGSESAAWSHTPIESWFEPVDHMITKSVTSPVYQEVSASQRSWAMTGSIIAAFEGSAVVEPGHLATGEAFNTRAFSLSSFSLDFSLTTPTPVRFTASAGGWVWGDANAWLDASLVSAAGVSILWRHESEGLHPYSFSRIEMTLPPGQYSISASALGWASRSLMSTGDNRALATTRMSLEVIPAPGTWMVFAACAAVLRRRCR